MRGGKKLAENRKRLSRWDSLLVLFSGSLSIVGVNKIQNQVSAAGTKAPAAFLRPG
jgi:hypothetical protein